MKTAHVERARRRATSCRLSDGQRQRVMLTGAIAQDRVLLVLDEPTSYLGISATRSTCCEYFATLCEIAECGCHHVHPRTRARAEKRRQGDLREGRPGSSAPAQRRHIHARDDWRSSTAFNMALANERFGSGVEIGRPHGDAHTFVIAGTHRYGSRLCFASSSGKEQGAFYAGVSARRAIDCEARTRPGGGMRGRARLRAIRDKLTAKRLTSHLRTPYR